jgi:tagaturonate reductase
MTSPILQFGTGRFLQAHVDLFVSEALSRNEAIGRIAAVRTTSGADSRKRLEALASGKPYVVQVRGLANGAVVDERVKVSSIGAALDATDDWTEVERLFNEARCVISNTADRGYETDPADRLEARPPKSFPAKLAKLLIQRHRAGAEPLTLFPCELTPENGKVLRAAVLGEVDRWQTPANVRRWIDEDCRWVNSLVDRIVSQPLEPVGAVTEPYALWAIEDQPGLELPCRHPAITVTSDLKPFEQLKLFILNLGHTYVAELWARRGTEPSLTVREAMSDPYFRSELDYLYDKEVLPVFEAMGMKAEARSYRATVIERFSNPFLDHRLADIYDNHAAKKLRRFGGLIALAERNHVLAGCPRLAAALASDTGRRPTPTG